MATSSQITMLREITAAGDRERTGALDVEWEGAHATLFFMFGHPSHVVYETTDGRKLDGEPALEAIVDELPTEFRVAPWRRAMVTDDTLHCSAEDLMGLFQRRNNAVESNGHAADPTAPPAAAPGQPAPATDAAPSAPAAAAAPVSPVAFGLTDFPLLPRATAMWTDAAANVVNLESALPRLPDCFLVLDGPTCRGVALIAGGKVTEAVCVTAAGGQLGDAAAHAVMNSLEGTLTAYKLDDARIAGALPVLWRAPRLGYDLPAPWLHTDDIVAEVRTSGRTCALVVDSTDPGVALFAEGELVAVYTASQPWPATSMAALRTLLHEAHARVTVFGTPALPSAVLALTAAEPETPGEPEAVVEAEAVVEPEAAVGLDAVVDAGPETAAEAEAVVEPEGAVELDAAVGAEPETAAEAEAVVEPEGAVELDAVVDAEPEAAAELDAVVESVAVAEPEPPAEPDGLAEPDAVAEPEAAAEPEPVAQPRSRLRGRGRGRNREAAKTGLAAYNVTESPAANTAVAVSEETWSPDAQPAAAGMDTEPEPTVAAAPPAVEHMQFEPAVFTIADLATTETPVHHGMEEVEAREATEFVPARLEIDVDALRAELNNIATVWLGEDDAAPVAHAIDAARPGVDDFVSTIAAIGAMEIPGHETAVVRAMAREMHFRASEVLCGV